MSYELDYADVAHFSRAFSWIAGTPSLVKGCQMPIGGY
jgi:hypothetical protein